MEDLERVAQRLLAGLDEKERLREEAWQLSRGILRAATGAVRALHQGEEPGEAILGAVREAARLQALLARHPDLYGAGFVEEALQELAEAAAVHAILSRKAIPAPEDIHCPPVPYLLGLGDAVGELRRASLDAMRRGRWREAEEWLAWMDKLFDVLLRFDQQVAAPVRRKQDVARSLIERTRGELTVASRRGAAGGEIRGLLDEAEESGAPRPKRPPPQDLDLDAESEYERR